MDVSATSESLLIVGIGNELLGDEGLGVHVARALLQRRPALPAAVEVLEAGTALLDVLPEMSRYSRVVIVDAIRGGKDPGTVYRAELDLDCQPARGALPLSLHQVDVVETLAVADALGLRPRRLTLVGAEPESMAAGTELSPRLAKAAQAIASLLAEEASGGREAGDAQVTLLCDRRHRGL